MNYSGAKVHNLSFFPLLATVYTISPSGMELFMDILQSILVDMGVDLGGGNVRMAQHHLYRPQVGAMGEQVGGE